jgi:signal transduction histidine kinase
MKRFFQSFYGKLSIVFLVLLLVMAIAQVLITVQASMQYVSEAEQKVNLRLAKDVAAEFSPYLTDSLDLASIEHQIHYMMIINPKIEIYLLDGSGKILAFFAEPKKKVQSEVVDLQPIEDFLSEGAKLPILGDDPRHPGRKKTFSVAPLKIGKDINGYLYIITESERYDSAAGMIRESYIVQTTIKGLIITLIFTAVIGMILFSFLTRRLRAVTDSVKGFEQGKLDNRVDVRSNDELGQLAKSFNQMADTIVLNMEELKRTDDLRRELVAGVSHDLRSPLASIQGYLETILIKDEKLSPEEKKNYLEIILSNTQLLSKLVAELFELSKLDAKQVQPKPEQFSIAELTQDVVMKLRPQAEKNNIHLEPVFPKEVPRVYADIALIERAMSNLIENAILYTPTNGTVKVVLSKSEKKVSVTVSDTGRGIPPKDLPYIFDRFYRVERSRNRTTGGTGLGLAISKKILELHGSDITVESEVNVGTKFYFDLNTLDYQTVQN